MIVEGTPDGLAAARARGRVGGRPPALSQRQLDQAQLMYDSGEHTVDEIADTFHVGRATRYRYLGVHHDGGDCVLVVYRNTRTQKIDADTNRGLGETGQSEAVQLEADRKWWPIAATRESRVKAIVYVAGGMVIRVRGIQPGKKWNRDDRGYADVPVTEPLTDLEIAEQLPTLDLRIGDHRPHVRGKVREYLPSDQSRYHRTTSEQLAQNDRRRL